MEGGNAVRKKVMANYGGDKLALAQLPVEERAGDAKHGPKQAANGGKVRGQKSDQGAAVNQMFDAVPLVAAAKTARQNLLLESP